MRVKFEKQLQKLNNCMISMCNLCEQAIENSIKALFTDAGDDDSYNHYAEIVFATDSEIDKMETEIEALCLKLIVSQQPVAIDLRRISAALKMISDLERIGDQASDITELAGYIRCCKIEHKLHLREMSKTVLKMLKMSVEAFTKNSIELAEGVVEMDVEVDMLFDKVKKELIEIISRNDTDSELCIDLLMVSKYLERIGDHAENIAGWVEFSVTGVHC